MVNTEPLKPEGLPKRGTDAQKLITIRIVRIVVLLDLFIVFDETGTLLHAESMLHSQK